MLLRNLLDFMFASPVMAVSSLVSVACTSILVVNISSNMTTQNEAAGISDKNYRDASFQRNSSGSKDTSYVNQGSDEQLKADFQSGAYSSNQPGSGFKGNRSNTNRNLIGNSQYYVDDYNDVATSNENPAYSNAPSLLNYSNNGNANSVSSPSATSANTTATENNATSNVTGFEDNPYTSDTQESDFPASLENTVKVDLDETQTISCRPVVADGPPCMCTFTLSDANGSTSEVVNNCS